MSAGQLIDQPVYPYKYNIISLKLWIDHYTYSMMNIYYCIHAYTIVGLSFDNQFSLFMWFDEE